MDILITDVTNLKGQICVAGWCEAEGRMIRPLQGAGGHHWPVETATPHMFQMGNVVRLQPGTIGTDRPFPHAREDLIVSAAPRLVEAIPAGELPRRLSPSQASGVDALFSSHLEDRRFVREGTSCSSLGAIKTGARQIGFKETAKPDGSRKLRAWFFDGVADHAFDFPVSSRSLNSVWEEGGLDALEGLKHGCRHAHIRIGLAMAFPQDQCFAMVNNVLFF